jgi:hypothetical protein
MATAAGESPTTTNGFCSPAFDVTGIEQRVAIELTATRLRMTGGIDITFLPREGGHSCPPTGNCNGGFWRGALLPDKRYFELIRFHVKKRDGFGRARLPNALTHFAKRRLAIDEAKLDRYTGRAVDTRITAARRG